MAEASNEAGSRVLFWPLPKVSARRGDIFLRRVGRRDLKAFVKTLWRQLLSRQGLAYGRFLTRVLRQRPGMFPEAVRFAIEGYHFEKVTRQVIAG